MTLADQYRTRRIENLAIVLGFLSLIVVAFARPHMDAPKPITASSCGAVRG